MAIPIPPQLVEFILFGPTDDRRQLQDSPILGDVWIRYGSAPDAALDLLISPYKGESSGKVANAINQLFLRKDDGVDRQVAYLQGFIAARLTFEVLLRHIIPRTRWWRRNQEAITKTASRPATKSPGVKKSGAASDLSQLKYLGQLLNGPPGDLTRVVGNVFALARKWRRGLDATGTSNDEAAKRKKEPPLTQELPPMQRFVALAGLILWVATIKPNKAKTWSASKKEITDLILDELKKTNELAKLTKTVAELGLDMPNWQPKTPDVWDVSLNRTAVPALAKSVPAVKADAARTLFTVDCSSIAWAVIDSGIDGAHPAFRDSAGNSRIKQSFDFHNFRRIVSLSNGNKKLCAANAKALMSDKERLVDPPDNAERDLARLAGDVEDERPIHWDLVRRFVEIKSDTPPPTNHGTHVAGILGASKKAAADPDDTTSDAADGMCPDIQLYDFRVLAPDVRDTEFAIIAVLQFIRYLNSQDNFLKIHGANLSLSIPHDVRNYACGSTPICVECERLIENGVVVVAAAGNHGYKTYQTKDGAFDSYAAFSITDPGNADEVLTVGSTHRFWPHTYGVSFFSSRGPTGDGRMKPDLVAPGERIRAPFPDNDWGDLDGTSMAAPHVSGAAAMLMARYTELIGHPRRVKKILCDSATDLQRERSFQGSGMLDVLRAFQSI